MANSLSEGFVRLTYTGITIPHHAMFPINFEGTPTAGIEPSFTTKDAGSITAEDGINALLDVYKGAFNGATQFGLVEVYAVDPDTEERTFIYAFNADTNGTVGSGNVEFCEAVLTFKTIGGGILKLYMMEGASGVDQKLRPPFDDSGFVDTIADYVVSGDSILIGRDNTYAFAPISFTTKTNDVLRKRGLN